MTEENEVINDFKYTTLVKIEPGKANLAIHTGKEWQKGFALVNNIIAKIGSDEWVEEWTDEEGQTHTKHHIHPQLLPWIQERRRVIDQYWKISGGEAVTEGKKQAYKNMADMIFNMRQDKDFIKEHEKEFKEIIEVEDG